MLRLACECRLDHGMHGTCVSNRDRRRFSLAPGKREACEIGAHRAIVVTETTHDQKLVLDADTVEHGDRGSLRGAFSIARPCRSKAHD